MALTRDDIHVWYATLDQPPETLKWFERILSADELTRAKNVDYERERDRIISSRGLLRTILGWYLGIAPSKIEFQYNSNGKPFLAKKEKELPNANGIRFNLAHSHGLALYAFSLGREVGIDIELIRPFSEAEQFVTRFFSEEEKARFKALGDDEKCRAFYEYWTSKEAYLKARGEGLTPRMDKIDVPIASEDLERSLNSKEDVEASSHWFLHHLTPSSGFAAALVVKGSTCQVSCWQLQDQAFYSTDITIDFTT